MVNLLFFLLLISISRFILSKSPLVLRLMLVSIIFVTSLAQLWAGLTWVALARLIIFLGGMIVVFIYMVNLRRKGKVKIKGRHQIALCGLVVLSIRLLLAPYPGLKLNINPQVFYGISEVPTLILLGVFLIFMVLICVKLTKSQRGPLKC